MIRESARDRAGLPPERLVAELRATVGSRRHNVGLTPLGTLIDVLVHGQDIAVPLHRELPMSPAEPLGSPSSTGTAPRHYAGGWNTPESVRRDGRG